MIPEKLFLKHYPALTQALAVALDALTSVPSEAEGCGLAHVFLWSSGAAMRKLLHLAFGVLKSGKPFDPELKII